MAFGNWLLAALGMVCCLGAIVVYVRYWWSSVGHKITTQRQRYVSVAIAMAINLFAVGLLLLAGGGLNGLIALSTGPSVTAATVFFLMSPAWGLVVFLRIRRHPSTYAYRTEGGYVTTADVRNKVPYPEINYLERRRRNTPPH